MKNNQPLLEKGKNPKINFLIVSLGIIGFVIMIIIYNRNTKQFNIDSVPITKKNSLNLNVESFYINHGTLIVNHKYTTRMNYLEKNSSGFLTEWYNFPDSFRIKKKADNDTIFFMFPKIEEYIVLLPTNNSEKDTIVK